jgi:hypothetical protein
MLMPRYEQSLPPLADACIQGEPPIGGDDLQWSRLSQPKGLSNRGLKHLTSTPTWRSNRQNRREAWRRAASQS